MSFVAKWIFPQKHFVLFRIIFEEFDWRQLSSPRVAKTVLSNPFKSRVPVQWYNEWVDTRWTWA